MPWIGIGSAVVGGALGALGSSSASRAQQKASAAQIAEMRRQFDLMRADQAPFLRTGTAANARLAALLGLDPNDPGNAELLRSFSLSDLEADPVYQSGLQFGLDEGRNAINARAIAGGGYDSGATLKALTRFGTDYGSTKANEAYNRFVNNQTNIYNRLAGVSGTGQVAANQINAAQGNMANQVYNAMGSGGNARAAGIVGGANAWGNALGGINSAYNRRQDMDFFSQLIKGSGSGGSYNPYSVFDEREYM